MLKSLKWSAILTACIYIASGIFLLAYPDKVQAIICNVVGISAIVIGVVRVFSYLASDVQEAVYRNDFVEGVVFILAGILVIYQKETVQALIPFIIAIAVLVDGFSKLQDGIDAKRLGYDKSYIYVGLAAVSIVVGLVIMFNLIETSNLIFQILGAGMIYCGITNLFSTLFLANRIDKFIRIGKQAIKEAQKEEDAKTVDAEIIHDDTEK